MTKSLHIFHSSRTRQHHLEWWDAFCGSIRGGPEHWSHWSAGSWPIRDGRSSPGDKLSFLPTSDGNEDQPRSHETCSRWLRVRSGHKTPGWQVMPQWECNCHVCLSHNPLTPRQDHLIPSNKRAHAHTHRTMKVGRFIQHILVYVRGCTWSETVSSENLYGFRTCDPTLVFIFLGFCNIFLHFLIQKVKKNFMIICHSLTLRADQIPDIMRVVL